jgi:DNA-binding winged helix-turn-helix (wHTH) protein/TolB-like protein
VTPCSVDARRFGCFEVDFRLGELRREGVRVRLEDQPFQILVVLLERPGEVVTREELRRRLWPVPTFVDFDRRLNVAMAKLRAALGDSGSRPRYIETLYRRGYRFLVPVTAPPASVPEPGRGWTRRSRLVVIAAALALIASAHHAIRGPLPRRSVAVLGFTNLSGEARQAWLSTALSEWLTTELSAGERLRTIPAARVARLEIELPPSPTDALTGDRLKRIGDNLGTEWIVAGSYARLGETRPAPIRMDVRLIDVRNGETLAAFSETGLETDLSRLVSRAGGQLRARLGLPPLTGEASVLP